MRASQRLRRILSQASLEAQRACGRPPGSRRSLADGKLGVVWGGESRLIEWRTVLGLSSSASRVSNVQYAALPWRRAKRGIEILLITTSNTRRWIVPKGWPVEGLDPAECAAQEALEEAGVLGEVAAEPLGYFRHSKERKSGEILLCTVYVFAMEVLRQRHSW